MKFSACNLYRFSHNPSHIPSHGRIKRLSPGAPVHEHIAPHYKFRLKTVYCPPLDTSLLAVFMADLEAECKAQGTTKPSAKQMSTLRKSLSELATLAEEQNYDEAILSPESTPSEQPTRSTSFSSEDTPEWSSGNVTTPSSSEASYGKSYTSNIASPLGFLRAAFPHMDVANLRSALGRAGENEVDMEAIVEELLTSEHILESEERDLDPSLSWTSVENKKPKTKKSPLALSIQTTKKNNGRGAKIAITDVRQRQNNLSSPSSPSSRALDPWSRLTSLATHLATLLPSYSASYFQSAFHAPQHSSPAKALRSCISSIGGSDSSELSSAEKTQLFGMFDILRSSPGYDELNREQQGQVLTDARVALRATHNDPDTALEIVELILDLETKLDLGIYHSLSPTSPTLSRYTTKLPSGPPPILSPLTLKSRSGSPTIAKTQINDAAWQSVPERKISQGPHPLAASIPAYNPGRRGKIKGSGNGQGKGGKGDVGELTRAQRIAQLRRERDESLREATRYWKSGSAGNRGGEVAMYFAQRVRHFSPTPMLISSAVFLGQGSSDAGKAGGSGGGP
jgi:hypothetical protein